MAMVTNLTIKTLIQNDDHWLYIGLGDRRLCSHRLEYKELLQLYALVAKITGDGLVQSYHWE